MALIAVCILELLDDSFGDSMETQQKKIGPIEMSRSSRARRVSAP